MRKNYGAKPYSYPQPVFIIASFDENGVANAMNAAWGGISDDQEVSICLGSDHKTTSNILQRKAFTISMGDAAHVAACDYLGIETGNRVSNKLEKAGFTVSQSEYVDAPIINELAVCMECEWISYDAQTCRLVGKIVNVSVDESVLTDGKVDIQKVSPIAFDPFNMTYVKMNEIVGKAFHDGKALK